MNFKILKRCAVFLLLLFMGASCQKDEIEIADESIEIYSSPGIAIYKTRGNYLKYIALRLDSLNNINPTPGYTKEDSRVNIDNKGNVTFSRRWLLQSGFIVDKEAYNNQSFTNITIGEFVDYTSKYNSGAWTDEMLLPRIIDRDPFLSFYYLNGINKPEKKFTLGEINDMIENGTIETVFTKLK